MDLLLLVMATAILYYYLENLWPFKAFFKFDDVKESNRLVEQLSVPKHTKEFIFAIREPDSQAVIYVLCVQNLSERSAQDADCLIRTVKPDAVVVQVGHGFDDDILRSKEIESKHGLLPTSWFEVLKRCFVHKINKDEYDVVAGSLVMREIFGIELHGHFTAAKRAAEAVGSSFLLLESPFTKNCGGDGVPADKYEWGNMFAALACQPGNLVSQKVVGSFVPTSSTRLFRLTDGNLHAVRSFSTCLMQSIPVPNGDGGQLRPKEDYEPPAFAQPIYSLLLDLHNIFVDIPSMASALAHAQRMLNNVSKGETVDGKLVSEVYAFQIAVEGLRIALNNASRAPISPMGSPNSGKPFLELDDDDKSHVVVAQTLKSQAKKFRSIVAVMDASSLAGLRKYWATSIPNEVKGIVEELIMNCDDGELSSAYHERRRFLMSKPVVAVGAGATAILGASSLSKVVPASTLMKVVTYKAPVSLKLLLSHTQKVVAIMSKSVGPSKILSPGIKASASAEKIRAVVHSVIASAEKTSLSAMRTAFYEIMRKRRVRPIGFLPWATFGCSIATCSGLLMYGDGIECVAESLPSAPSIASLGRGIQSLQLASQSVRQAESSRIKKSIDALMYRFKNTKANDVSNKPFFFFF